MRLPAGWLAIPLFAILTTGLVVVVGNRSRMGGSGAHGTVFEVSPAGTEAYVSGLVLSRSGGDHGFQLPSGWAPTTGSSMFTSFDGNAATHRVDGNGSDLVRSLDSGQAAVFKAVGPAAAPNDQLRVEATSEANGTISGSVHNPGSNALVDVAVFAGERAVLIGTLPAGTSAPFELLDVTASAGIAPAAQVWSMDQRFGGPAMPIGPPMPTGVIRMDGAGVAETRGPGGFVGPGGPVGPAGGPDRPALPATTASQTADVGLWLEASVDNPLLTYGSVRAAGWRPDTTAPLELLGGRRIDRGRSAVTVAAPIEPAGPITDVTVRRKLTSLSGEVGPDGQTALFRFLLPPNSRPPNVDYELTIPVGMGSAEAWNGARWVSMQAPEGVSLLPSETVRSGVVLIRIDGLRALSFSAGLTVREQL